MVFCDICKSEMHEGSFRQTIPKALEVPAIDSDERPSIYAANLF